MKENEDNDNNNKKKDIKNLMKYFNYNVKRDSLSKIDNITNIINKKKINLSSIYKEYINEKQMKKNENEIIYLIEDDNYYSDIINKNLNELKNNTISFLNDIKDKINNNYKSFSENINIWLKKRDKKLSKIISDSTNLKIYINYMKENIFDRIKKIFDIHNYIFNSLKDQFSLLSIFLEENNLIKYNCPLEEFILKNSNFILNSWLLSKINMESLCLSKFLDNKDLADLFQNYYSKKKEDIFFKSIYLKNENKRNYVYEPNISKYNVFKINKLKLKTMSGDNINKIYKKISAGEKNFDNNKIKIISLSNLDLFGSSIEGLSKLNFPILEKIKIKNCIIPYHYHYLFKTIISKTDNLKSIKIEKVKLTDKSFSDFISFLSKNNSMLDKIEYLSFKDNNLNSINFDHLTTNKLVFKNVEIIDLSNNNIYNFPVNNFKLFPKLLILDICNNNINNNLLFEGVNESKKQNKINFIVLMCKNIFLYNINHNNKRYIQYLNENLINYNYKIKSINLSLLYNKDNREEISNLLFSPMIKLSLIKLDLSYCGLNDNCLSSFLKNNFDLISLKTLNISNNFLTIKFFSLLTNEGENLLLEKINNIDISFNKVKYQSNNDLLRLNKFIDRHSYLKKIKLNNNEFINIFKKSEKVEEYKKELDKIINLCKNRNIKFYMQTELFNYIDKDIFKDLFIFKDKYY